MVNNSIIPIKVKEEAKRLYFNYWSPREISDFLQQNYETVRKWVTRYDWYKEREATIKDELSDLANRRAHQMNKVMTDGLDAMIEAVANAKKGATTIDDAEKISKMIANIDKLYRLQTGKPTEIKEERKYTSVEHKALGTKESLLKALKDDPFMDVEYEDVTNKNIEE